VFVDLVLTLSKSKVIQYSFFVSKKMITIGEILKPKGIKGALKIRPTTDDIQRFRLLERVYIDGTPYPVQSALSEGGFVVLSLGGVSDRNTAELLRGKLLQIDRAAAVLPEDGAYFIADIVGCALTDETGKKLGVITNVESFGAADVITGTAKGKEFRFPFLNRVVAEIDVAAKRFCVYKKLWEEVVVFDD